MVRGIGVPFGNSGVTSPSLLYLISIIIYSCNIIIVIAAIPHDHRRLLPRQFEEGSIRKDRSIREEKKTNNTFTCEKWKYKEWFEIWTRVFLALELRRVVADDRDAWSRENGGENGNRKKKKEKKKRNYIYLLLYRELCAAFAI